MDFTALPSNEPAADHQNAATAHKLSGFKRAWLFWLLAIPALWWALREVPVPQIAATIANLRGWQIAVLLVMNLAVIAVFSLRWWFILKAMGGNLPFVRAIGYHLAGFGMSYFTAGPQVGGEPLQVMLVSHNDKIKFPVAVSSVFLDKVFELLTNFTFLIFGSLLIFSRSTSDVMSASGWWVVAGVLLALPLLHLLALRKGSFPVSRFLARLPWPWLRKVVSLTAQSEEHISQLFRVQPGVILSAAVISAAGWLLMFAEYALMIRFMGGIFNATQIFTAFLASQLAFLTPLPGGLGALEASQVMVFTSFGALAGIGLSVSLLMRARDVLFGLMGLAIAGTALNKRSAQPRAVPVQEK